MNKKGVVILSSDLCYHKDEREIVKEILKKKGIDIINEELFTNLNSILCLKRISVYGCDSNEEEHYQKIKCKEILKKLQKTEIPDCIVMDTYLGIIDIDIDRELYKDALKTYIRDNGHNKFKKVPIIDINYEYDGYSIHNKETKRFDYKYKIFDFKDIDNEAISETYCPDGVNLRNYIINKEEIDNKKFIRKRELLGDEIIKQSRSTN